MITKLPEKVFGAIYVLHSTAKDRIVYCGQTTRKYIKNYIKHSYNNDSKYNKRKKVINHIRKYGKNDLVPRVLCYCKDISSLNNMEECIIKKYDLTKNGLNIKKGGDNHLMSEETKRKISKANKGKKRTADFKRKMSKLKKGHEVTNDTKLKKSRPIINEDGTLFFISARHAKENGYHNVTEVVRGTRKTCKGHVFRDLATKEEIEQQTNKSLL